MAAIRLDRISETIGEKLDSYSLGDEVLWETSLTLLPQGAGVGMVLAMWIKGPGLGTAITFAALVPRVPFTTVEELDDLVVTGLRMLREQRVAALMDVEPRPQPPNGARLLLPGQG